MSKSKKTASSAEKKAPPVIRGGEKVVVLKEGEKVVDLNGFKEKIRSEVSRLERLSQMDAPWAARSDGRASGLHLAASLLSDFIKEEKKEPGKEETQ